jgi:hypothetical protein
LGDKDDMVVGELLQQEIVKIIDLYRVKGFRFGADHKMLECVEDDGK